MTSTMERIKNELSTLPQNERAELAQFLINTLDGAPEADAESAWDPELVRRIELICTGKDIGEPAEDVFKTLREKYE